MRNPTRDHCPGPWAWLSGYTCTAHRVANTDPLVEAEILHCACKPSLPLRVAFKLGLTLELAPTPEPRWCTYTWPAPTDHGQPDESHLCELQHDHGAPEHACDCGARQLTDRATNKLLRAIHNPAEYDQCLWPEETPCPVHDKHLAWPAGRDCTGTCTNCNATADQDHAPSCWHATTTGDTRA